MGHHLTRRSLVAALAGIVAAPSWAVGLRRKPVVYVHMDRLEIDATGEAFPYCPARIRPPVLPEAVFERHIYL